MNIIKYIYLCFTLMFFSCHSGNSGGSKPYTSDSTQLPINNETTDMVFNFPADEIPNGFYLDTLAYYDAEKHVEFTMYWLKAKADSLEDYNKTIVNEFNTQVERALMYYDIPQEDYFEATVEYGPQQIHADSKMISTQFIVDSYSWGGAHHNYNWYSVNYDLNKRAILRFKHVFKLCDHSDTIAFLDTIGKSILERPIAISQIGNDTIDFFMYGDTIEFGPNLSWAEGMHTARLHKNILKKYLTGKAVR